MIESRNLEADLVRIVDELPIDEHGWIVKALMLDSAGEVLKVTHNKITWHAATVKSVAKATGLSPRNIRRVADALEKRGIASAITVNGEQLAKLRGHAQWKKGMPTRARVVLSPCILHVVARGTTQSARMVQDSLLDADLEGWASAVMRTALLSAASEMAAGTSAWSLASWLVSELAHVVVRLPVITHDWWFLDDGQLIDVRDSTGQRATIMADPGGLRKVAADLGLLKSAPGQTKVVGVPDADKEGGMRREYWVSSTIAPLILERYCEMKGLTYVGTA